MAVNLYDLRIDGLNNAEVNTLQQSYNGRVKVSYSVEIENATEAEKQREKDRFGDRVTKCNRVVKVELTVTDKNIADIIGGIDILEKLIASVNPTEVQATGITEAQVEVMKNLKELMKNL